MAQVRKTGHYKRLVVKVGTSTITYPNGRLNLRLIEKLAWELTDFRNRGLEVALVSSGAIGVGSVRLGFVERPTLTRQKQAAAAVGQAALMQIYQNFFNTYHQTVAQILLTKEDFLAGERRENTINTMNTLFEMGVIPIINANDVTSTYEIEGLVFSDNDQLSATVAGAIQADLLVLLTDIDALYDHDPRRYRSAHRVAFVPEITPEIMAMAGAKGSKFSVGGMSTKLLAADLCLQAGVDMVIAEGKDPAVLNRILDGEDIGTLFSNRSGKQSREEGI